MNKEHIISKIELNSPASRLGFKIGDCIQSINGNEVIDIFDFHFLINDDQDNEIILTNDQGEEKSIVFSGISSQNLGISFENGLMDDYKHCHNNCMFCFIDQMPKGMRETLYFKDDDARLSFLNGNYITMTNMSYEDIDRIIYYRLSPMNISVHTTNPELRCKMLNNRFAGDILDKIEKFYASDINMNGQIVLCKGLNDGEELERTIQDLSKFYPAFGSLSVVPVGLTKYREGLFPLEGFSRDDARVTLNIIEKWQKKLFDKYGVRFVYASDEWYLLAGRNIPSEKYYDGYPQLENGVGMLRNLIDSFRKALTSSKKHVIKKHHISIATGKLAAPTIRLLASEFMRRYPKILIDVYEIENNYFGEKITVAGLLTAKDLKEQLLDKNLGERLLLTSDMLRAGEDVFLDDVHVNELEAALRVKIDIVNSNGVCLLDAMLMHSKIKIKGTGNYE